MKPAADRQHLIREVSATVEGDRTMVQYLDGDGMPISAPEYISEDREGKWGGHEAHGFAKSLAERFGHSVVAESPNRPRMKYNPDGTSEVLE